MEELIKLDAYPIRGLVGRLLQDKTTRKNIMFASESYADYGAGYRDDSQMTEGVLLGFDSCDIQPRVYKVIISPLGTHQSATRKTVIRNKERTNPKRGTH